MVRRCCVPGCSSDDRKSSKEATYHTFPWNPQIRKQWLDKINAPSFKITKNRCVCSAHFKKEDYKPQCQHRARLYTTAVPSIFVNNNDQTKSLKNKKQNARTRKKKFPVEIKEEKVQKIDGKKRSSDENECLKRKLAEVNSELEDQKLINNKMQRSIKELIKENEQLKNSPKEEKEEEANDSIPKLKSLAFKTIIHDDNLIQFYTGFIHSAAYLSFYRYLEIRAQRSFAPNQPFDQILHEALSFEEMFFLTLMRLKLGFPGKKLARIFAVSVVSVNQIFIKWINILNYELRDWFSILAADRTRACSKIILSKTTLMIDCIEVQIASREPSVDSVKALLAVTTNGSVCFVSRVFSGAASFRTVVEKSGFLNFLTNGHLLMTDKGFDISDLLPEGLPIILPSKCFQSESGTSALGRKAEVDFDKIVRKVKSYLILNSRLPLSLRNVRKEIITVCAMLCNFKSGINARGKWLKRN